jgi:hypothetical protein
MVPVLLLCAIGLLSRCRFGLLFLAVPAAVVGALGADMAGSPGDPADPDPRRPFAVADLVADLTRPNWVVAAVLLLALTAVVARRVRQSGSRPDPQAGQGRDVG